MMMMMMMLSATALSAPSSASRSLSSASPSRPLGGFFISPGTLLGEGGHREWGNDDDDDNDNDDDGHDDDHDEADDDDDDDDGDGDDDDNDDGDAGDHYIHNIGGDRSAGNGPELDDETLDEIMADGAPDDSWDEKAHYFVSIVRHESGQWPEASPPSE
eukprot:6109054-Karenia_brevis.AAC.1